MIDSITATEEEKRPQMTIEIEKTVTQYPYISWDAYSTKYTIHDSDGNTIFLTREEMLGLWKFFKRKRI